MAQQATSSNYSHGHSEPVLRSHSWRTIKNSCQYLVDAGIINGPSSNPALRILDVGCGPGTITADLAKHVPKGHVIGIEPPVAGEDILNKAREHAKQANVSNVEFISADVMNLSQFKDGEFDLVHSHQVLQHLADPVGALKEMKRVTKNDGGIVAARVTDFETSCMFPVSEGLADWKSITHGLFKAMGGECDAGRHVHDWFRQAGFEWRDKEKFRISASTWCFTKQSGESEWWGNMWADRMTGSELGELAVEKGLATKEQLEKIAEAWREWSKDDMAWFSMIHGEVIATV